MAVEENANTTEDQIVLTKPEGGASTNIQISGSEMVSLNFSPADISKVAVNTEGALEIQFADGSSIVVTDYASALGAANAPQVQLAGGDVIDLSVLTSSLMSGASADTASAADLNAITPAAGADASTASNDAVQTIDKPAAGEKVTMTLESGQNYALGFGIDAPQDAQIINGDLVITFGDGGQLIIPEYESISEDTAMIFPDGSPVSVSEFPTVLSLAAQLNEVEPAAGEAAGGAGNTGFGFQTPFQSTSLESLDAIGPINPTALNYRAPDREYNPVLDPIADPEFSAPDQIVFEDGSVALSITAAPANADGTEFITVSISGIDAAWGVDTTTSGGTYDVGTGTWTITLPAGASLTGGPTLLPPADSDADMPGPLTLEVVATDTVTGDTATVTDTFTVTTDAVADTPDVAASDATGLEDTAIPLNLSTAVNDLDGSESIVNIVLSGVPAGAVLNNGTDLGGGNWELTLADLTGLTIAPPSDYSGSFDLTLTSTAEETTLTDDEITLANNVADNATTFTVTVTPDADAPKVSADDVIVKEDGSVVLSMSAELADTDGSETLSVSISGIPAGWTVTDLAGGTYDAGTGTWTFDVPAGTTTFTGGPTIAPPADTDADIVPDLTASATATETGNGDTSTSTASIAVLTDAVIDTPDLVANDATGNEDAAIALDISTAVTDLDGSEEIVNIIIGGVPAGATLNNGTDLGGGNWELTLADLTGLTITPPADYSGSFPLSVTVTAEEVNLSGGEDDYTDNVTTVVDDLIVTVKEVIDPPKLSADDVIVKEDGSVQVEVDAALTDPGTEQMTITITGIPSTWTVTDLDGGSYDAGTGTWTIDLPAGENFSGGPTIAPPADSDVDITPNLIVTADVTDTVTGTTTSATEDVNVLTDAVVDTPDLDTNDASGLEDTDIPLDIATAVNDLDGSEEIVNVIIGNVPAGASLNNGTDLGGGNWQLTVSDLTGLTITPPTNYSGSFDLSVAVTAEEVNLSDGEDDYTDNITTVIEDLTVTVTPDADAPKLVTEDVIVKEDGSVALDVTAELADTDGSEYLTVNIAGIPSTWTVTDLDGGTYDAGTGTWSITLAPGANFSGGPTIAPPADSDADVTPDLTVTATSTEVGNGDAATSTDSISVLTDAVIDAPDLDTSDASGEEDTAIPLDISTAVTDLDGSEAIVNIVIGNVPAGATLNNGTDLGGGNWELTTADLTGLTITPPTGYNGSFDLSVAVTAEEVNLSGGEDDYTDNITTVTDTLTVTVLDDDEPVIVDDKITVDETNLAAGDLVVNDQVNADFFGDDPGTFSATGLGSVTSSTFLSSNGDRIIIELTGNTYTGTTQTGGVEVFSLVLNTDGTYTFTQSEAIDHPNESNHNDALTINFGVTASDSDGDTDTGFITVKILDDGPTAEDDFNEFNTADGGTDGNVITGENGGPGAADTESQDDPTVVTQVSFEGTTVDVPATGSASIDGDFGTLELFADGSYTYTLNGGAGGPTTTSSLDPDQADIGSGNASFSDNGITVSVGTPIYGHLSQGTLSWVNTPDVGNGIGIAGNGSNKVWQSGEVLEVNFDQGASTVTMTLADIGANNFGDGIDYKVYLESDPTTPIILEFQLPNSTSDGLATFTIDVNDFAPGETISQVDIFSINNSSLGTSSFLLNNVVAEYPDTHSICDIFDYVIEDADGDTSTAQLALKGDGTPAIAGEAITIDETELASGDIVINDSVSVDYNGDGPGAITGNDTVTSTVTLTSNEQAIDVEYNAATGTYTGVIVATGVAAFTLALAANGDYTFTQFEAIDHPDTNDHDDALTISFGITATDADGDAVDGNILVTIEDDGPTARDDFNSYDLADGTTTGNVITGENGGPGADDTESQDDPTLVSEVSFGGTSVDVPEGGSATIDGDNGTLEIFSDGSYEYTVDPDLVGTQTTYSFSKDNPPGGDAGGDIKNVDTSYNEDTHEFTFSIVVDDPAGATTQGFTLAINNGPNPKGHPGEMALFYFDASGVNPIVSAYGYNGVNGFSSAFDGSPAAGQQAPDQIASSAAVNSPFTSVTSTLDANGNHVFSFSMDASVIVNHVPLYGDPADWSGVSFDDSIGMWLHPQSDISTSYNEDGYLTGWESYANSWYDTTNQPTEITETHNECLPDTFEYTIIDADGDTSTAELQLKGIAPVLKVGKNVDDADGSTTEYQVGDGTGDITGAGAGDILVGDVGGATMETQTQDYNIAMILDISGSMGSAGSSSSKMGLMIDAITNLIEEFGAYDNGNVRVHFAPFSSGAAGTGTFTVTDAAGLAAAIDYLEALNSGGTTNYEAGLQSSLAWLESGDTISGATTVSYFLSDGQPNRYINDSGNSVSGSESVAMDEIDGTRDGTSEIAQLQSLSDQVIGVGINIGSKIVNLDEIDSSGSALNVEDPDDLNAQLADSNPLNKLSALGDDNLQGGDGDDTIFGDTLFTDDLIADHGLTDTLPGSGWEVFAKLEAGESTLKPDWSREDTIEYIRDNAEALAAETLDGNGEARLGGDDVLYGGFGDDLMFGQEGDDLLYGGDGDDLLAGGSGADTFVFRTGENGVDTITDFNLAEGDILDISDVLTAYDPVGDNLSDFVQVTEDSGNTLVQVDPTGSGSFTTIAVLDGVTGLDIDALTSGGNLIA